MTDTTHTIVKSAKRFFSGTMLSRVSGMLRDMAMAYAFGTQEAVAAFLVAFRLSHLLRRLFGEGALQSAFIPQFETLRAVEPNRALGFFRDLTIWLILGLTFIIVSTMLVLGGVLAFVSLSPGNQEILFLTLLLMPSVLFICLFGLNASLLQCEKSYFISGVAPVMFNLLWILGVSCLWTHSAVAAMPWLAVWVILACAAQWLFTVPKVWQILRTSPISLKPNFRLGFQDVKSLAKPLFLAIVGVAATQVNSALDAIFARYADAEGPAYLWFALRIQQLPLALFGVAISGALLPPLTRALKNNDLFRFQQFLEFALRRSVLLMIPMTVGLVVIGASCVNLLYGRGDFESESIVGTTQCLWGYALGLIPMSLILIIAPAFYAQGLQKTPAFASVFSVGLNVILNAYFISIVGWGVTSVAIATSISSWMNLAMLAYALSDFQKLLHRENLYYIGKIVFASGIAGIVAFLLDGGVILKIVRGEHPQFVQGLPQQIFQFFIQSSSFIGVFWLTVKIFNVEGRIKLENVA